MEKKHMIDVTHSKGEGMEGTHKGSEVYSPGGPLSPRRLSSLRDPEVPEKAVRRRYTAAYKLRILKEAEGCKETGQCSALLRREGLYSSHLTTWHRQAEQGTLEAPPPRKRGPKVQKSHPLVKRVETLEKENQQLRHHLKQAKMIIEVQKKISEMLHLSPDPKGEKS